MKLKSYWWSSGSDGPIGSELQPKVSKHYLLAMPRPQSSQTPHWERRGVEKNAAFDGHKASWEPSRLIVQRRSQTVTTTTTNRKEAAGWSESTSWVDLIGEHLRPSFSVMSVWVCVCVFRSWRDACRSWTVLLCLDSHFGVRTAPTRLFDF